MAEDDKKETTVTPIRTIGADARTIYADSTRMGRSPWDLRMHFALLKETTPGVVHEEEQVVIIMSPQHAKVFSMVLAEHIGKYEKAFGVIPIESIENVPERKPIRASS